MSSGYYGDVHRTLVSSLVSHLAWSDAEVVAARGVGTLPRPEPIGGYAPDVIAEGPSVRVIGEAKSNPNVVWRDFVKQLEIWRRASGSSSAGVTLALAVPAGWRTIATRAAHDAGWEDEHLTILEVGLPDGPPAPTVYE